MAPAVITVDRIVAAGGDPAVPGDPVGRAFATAGRETRDAFISTSRAIRTAFGHVPF
jgi:hypothetical protein